MHVGQFACKPSKSEGGVPHGQHECRYCDAPEIRDHHPVPFVSYPCLARVLYGSRCKKYLPCRLIPHMIMSSITFSDTTNSEKAFVKGGMQANTELNHGVLMLQASAAASLHLRPIAGPTPSHKN